MKIIRQQNFRLEFFEFEHPSGIYRVGLAGYREEDPGAHMFYPESGSEYMLVVYDTGWYKFELKEFTHKAGIEYIAEKLHCSESDADIIHDFVADILQTDAAKYILASDDEPFRWHIKNPFHPNYGG